MDNNHALAAGLPACLQAKAQSGFSFVLLLRLDRSLFYLRRDLHYSCRGEEGENVGRVWRRGEIPAKAVEADPQYKQTLTKGASKRRSAIYVGLFAKAAAQRAGGKTSGFWWLPQFLLAASDATKRGEQRGGRPRQTIFNRRRSRGVDGLRGGVGDRQSRKCASSKKVAESSIGEYILHEKKRLELRGRSEGGGTNSTFLPSLLLPFFSPTHPTMPLGKFCVCTYWLEGGEGIGGRKLRSEGVGGKGG